MSRTPRLLWPTCFVKHQREELLNSSAHLSKGRSFEAHLAPHKMTDRIGSSGCSEDSITGKNGSNGIGRSSMGDNKGNNGLSQESHEVSIYVLKIGHTS